MYRQNRKEDGMLHEMQKKGILKGSAMVVFLGVFLCLGGVASVCAEDAGEAKLLQKISELENRIKVLEGTQSQKEGAAPVTTKAEVEALVDQRISSTSPLLEALKGITLSGYVDTSYTYNTNHPDSGANTGRVFDTKSNSFLLQSAKVALEKLPEKTGGVGFRADIIAGEDGKVLNAATYGFSTTDPNDNSYFDLEQAYIDVMAPLGKGLDIKAGKFVTLAGAEVIEAKDNWNYSRGLLFGYAIPFTHTGVRLSYPLLDTLTGYFGVNNGWDAVKDNNKGKTMEGALAWVPKDWLSFNLTGYYGPEQAGNNHANRGLVDFITTFQPFKKLTLKINADYAREEDLAASGKAATWSGVAGYAKYDLNDKWSIANRAEYFNDPDGVRFQAGVDESLWENTSTLEFRPFKNLITRLEYRYDHSTADVFTAGSKAVDHQSTIGLQAIYVF
jgi:hypothetical protein